MKHIIFIMVPFSLTLALRRQSMMRIINIPPAQFQIELDLANIRTFGLCLQFCQKLVNGITCDKDIHLNETSHECQLGLVSGAIPSIPSETFIKVYKSPHTATLPPPVSHFYLANDIYSWDFSLNATASPPNAIPLFHGSRNRARGWLYRGGILLCGSDPDGECNFFHLASGESQQVNGWSDRRQDPGANSYQGQPWVLGGFNTSREAHSHSTTEVLSANGEWLPGPDLPYGVNALCAVALDDAMTKFLIVGGHNGTHGNNLATFTCEVPCDSWTYAGDVPGSLRRQFTCQRMQLSSGEDVVVAASGWTSTNQPSDEVAIYSISGGGGWRVGPTLPTPMGVPTTLVIEGRLLIAAGDVLYEMAADASGWAEPSDIPQPTASASSTVAVTYT